jgi:hypothetical protein
MGDQQRSDEPRAVTGGDWARAGVDVRAVSANEWPWGIRTVELA